MIRKKDFTKKLPLNNSVHQPVKLNDNSNEVMNHETVTLKAILNVTKIPPVNQNVSLPEIGNATSYRNFNFSPYYNDGYDEITYYCQRAIQMMVDESVNTKGGSIALATIRNYFNGGLIYFFDYCSIWSEIHSKNMTLNDIDEKLVNGFVLNLRSLDVKLVSQKDYYTCTKSVLTFMMKRKWISKFEFLVNPYPNINRLKKGAQTLSKSERRSLVSALKMEWKQIVSGTDPLTIYELTVAILIIALRTGLNPEPIYKLTTQSIQKHPFKTNRRILISYKRRGNATNIQALRESKSIEGFSTIAMDVFDVIETVTKRNSSIRSGSNYDGMLFCFTIQSGGHYGAIRLYNGSYISQSLKLLIRNHNLTNDSGEQLSLSISRLRKTFVNAMFELSDGDPVVTAKMANHSLSVSDTHYLTTPKEAKSNFRFMGEVRTQELLDAGRAIDIKPTNTPTGSCSDNINGHKAPRNGKPCDNFLGCIRCKSFVVTETDLYRLYSLYWLIVSVKNKVSAKQWSRRFSHVIRVIDNEIAPLFSSKVIALNKAKAKIKPHPFWRDLSNL